MDVLITSIFCHVYQLQFQLRRHLHVLNLFIFIPDGFPALHTCQ